MSLLGWYFGVLEQFGFPLVVAMMALAVPSELVIPPAAYILVKDHPDLGSAIFFALLVILAGAIGFCCSATIIYWTARGIGRPIIVKYGKYLLVPEKKLKLAEQWVARYGAGGIILGSMLPGIRHIICIPAGIVGMRFRTFTIMAFIGSGIWATVLTIFGLVMSKDMAAMLKSKAESASCQHALTNLYLGMGILIALIVIIYLVIMKRHSRPAPAATTASVADSVQ